MREIDPKTREIVGEEFIARAEKAAKSLSEVRSLMEDTVDELACKHCGRCVLAGPPCCYDKVYEMYQELWRERNWLRKVQSKKDKKINELKAEVYRLSSLLAKL